MACAEAESRLKCFLHYGFEDRIYIPTPVIKFKFESAKIQSIMDIISNEELIKNVVPLIVKVFRGGYSVEPCASLYALAMVIRKAKKNYKVVNEAYKAARKLSEESGEYFLIFTRYLREIAKTENQKGFGKGWRVSVQKWYESKEAMQLAQMVTKVKSVMNWNHRDVIALSRMKLPSDAAKAAVMSYVRNGYESANSQYYNVPEAKQVLDFLKSVESIRGTDSESSLINLITMHNFSIEYCPEKFIKSHEVWLALIPRMNMETLLANINRLSKLKLLSNRDIVREIVSRLQRLDVVDVSIHPTYVHIVRKRYELGPNLAIEFQYLQRRREAENANERGEDNSVLAGEIEQQVQRQPPPRRSPEIIEALSTLFNKSLSILAPTGLRYLIGLDSQSALESRTCCYERFVKVEEAASLIALCVIKAESESNVKLVTFGKDLGIKEIPIHKTEESLETIKNKINKAESGPAHLSQLINWATATQEKFDVIILLGDHTLVANGAHDALKNYRQKISEKAKVITCSFTGMHKKVRELSKPDMFFIGGFDKNVGRLIEAYSRGAF